MCRSDENWELEAARRGMGGVGHEGIGEASQRVGKGKECVVENEKSGM